MTVKNSFNFFEVIATLLPGLLIHSGKPSPPTNEFFEKFQTFWCETLKYRTFVENILIPRYEPTKMAYLRCLHFILLCFIVESTMQLSYIVLIVIIWAHAHRWIFVRRSCTWTTMNLRFTCQTERLNPRSWNCVASANKAPSCQLKGHQFKLELAPLKVDFRYKERGV